MTLKDLKGLQKLVDLLFVKGLISIQAMGLLGHK